MRPQQFKIPQGAAGQARWYFLITLSYGVGIFYFVAVKQMVKDTFGEEFPPVASEGRRKALLVKENVVFSSVLHSVFFPAPFL